MFFFSSRGVRFPSRLDRILHPHNAPHALRLRTRSTRLDRQLGPTAQTPPRLVHRPATVQDPQRPPGEQPVPSEVLRAGDRRLSRRRHVAHAPELGRRQVRRAERRSEALCTSRCMSMCTPSPFFYLAGAHVRLRRTARPVYTRSEPPRPIHDAHATDPSRIRPRDASLSFTHMRAYSTTALLDFFVLHFRKTGFWRPILQVVLADKYDSYRMTYEGCHVFNPGRFVGRSLGFSTYTPATRESEAWYVFVQNFPLPSRYPVRGTAHSDLPSVVDLEAEN